MSKHHFKVTLDVWVDASKHNDDKADNYTDLTAFIWDKCQYCMDGVEEDGYCIIATDPTEIEELPYA